MKKENKLMALLSVWGILLVVLGHSGFEEPIIKQELSGLHSWIYSFHMPLFFMISGYLFSLTNKSLVDIEPCKFMEKKAIRLLVPYVTIGTIVYLIKFAFSGLSHASRDFTVGNFFYMFIAPSDPNSTMGYLWYIVTLFVMFLIVVLLNKLHIDMKKTIWCIVLIVTFFALDIFMPRVALFNLQAEVHYMPAFLMGILLKKYEEPILTFINGGGILTC
ncbi:MAG: acyltransferase family protein [Prevotella sp.]